VALRAASLGALFRGVFGPLFIGARVSIHARASDFGYCLFQRFQGLVSIHARERASERASERLAHLPGDAHLTFGLGGVATVHSAKVHPAARSSCSSAHLLILTPSRSAARVIAR